MCRGYLAALGGRSGTIINISSGSSNGVPPAFSSYALGKSAVNRLSEYIHCGICLNLLCPLKLWRWQKLEHFTQGIRCFALHPGAVLTEQMGQSAPGWVKPYLTDHGKPGPTKPYEKCYWCSVHVHSGSSRRHLSLPVDNKGRFLEWKVCQLKLGYGRVRTEQGHDSWQGPAKESS